ncbi:FixH family protein [Metabacillus idriensis]|uniref:FixH family protein n=1 Tax=Metabacillus idriensis TaxID=324768 RepID=UPI00174C0B25|nr:FixH family protein [Metabacillus idriensis]
MKKLVILLISSVIILSACNTSSSNDETELNIIEVDLSGSIYSPRGEESIIQALVTQGEEKVTDAKVTFEVWKDGDKDHEMLEGDNIGKGLYSINKIFDREGLYNVIVHTYAKDMHIMPKIQFQIK